MRLGLVLLLGLVACGDSGPVADPYACMAAGGEGCFQLPSDVVAAATPDGAAAAPVLDCSPFVVETSVGSLSFSGRTVDLDVPAQPVGGVRVQAYADLTMTQILVDTTSDDAGAWSASAAVPSEAFARTTGPDQLPLQLLYRRIDINQATQAMFDVETATKQQVASLLETVGDRFLPGRTQVTAVALDCLGNRLVNAIANVAPASGRNGSRLFEMGVRVYYGTEGDAPAFGRRVELFQTTSAGTIAMSNLAPGKHFVQLWGFPNANLLAQGNLGLRLLDEREIIVPDGDGGIVLPLYGRF